MRQRDSRFTYSRPGLLLVLCGLAFLLGCSGSSTQSVKAPTALTYPQTVLNAVVGQAITADTPVVAGTATTFAVTPALPAGLALNTVSGAITGVPTVATASAVYTVTASNAGGATTSSQTIVVTAAPPTNLVYPATTLFGVVGQAIAPDTPTVTGPVTAFSVAPALPAGLALNTSTGTINGMPTAITPSAAYTVTASNSGGSTTAILTIAVAAAAPTNLAYPVASISGTAGQAITPDTPTISGSSVTFSITPALPAGLAINSTTGTISGTPTHSAPQSTYTVTASNSAGKVTAAVSITILNAQMAVTDLGQTSGIMTMSLSSTRLLELDGAQPIAPHLSTPWHWGLYNYQTAGKIADGVAASQSKIALAGSIFVVDNSTSATPELDIRSADDGSLQSSVKASYSWWQLASDGSYLVLGSTNGLSLYGIGGNLVWSHTGDYSLAVAFAAPQQVQIANGPKGNVIETVPVSGNSSSTSPGFSGYFQAWFADGGRFIASTALTTTIYSASGTMQQTVSSGDIDGGTGDWFYTSTASSASQSVQIYAVGNASPAMSFVNTTPGNTIWRSTATGNTIAVQGNVTTTVVDLSGPTPVARTYPSPPSAIPSDASYAAVSASQFVVGVSTGQIVEGSSLNGNYRLFGFGAAGLTGGTNYAVLANYLNVIAPYDATTLKPLPTLQPAGSLNSVSLSASGSVLAEEVGSLNVSTNTNTSSLNLVSLPSGAALSSRPDGYSYTLSSSGNLLAQTFRPSNVTTSFSVQTEPAQSGAATVLNGNVTSNGTTFSVISPDDSMVAVVSAPSNVYSTSLYKAGTLAATVPGKAVGWLDNGRLLVDLYNGTTYASSAIVSPIGAVLSTPALPELLSIQVVNSDQVYCPTTNRIYSVTTGSPVWTSNQTATGTGTIAGSYVLYVSGTRVLAESY